MKQIIIQSSFPVSGGWFC